MNTFYVIILGLILGIVITTFIILNNKINRTEFNTKFIIDALKRIDQFVEGNNIVINNIRDRFNTKVLKDNEHWVINEDHYNNIITLLKSRFKDVDDSVDSIYNRLNSMDNDTTILIIGKSNEICNEIKKQAKISSKINSKTKTKKNTDNKQKCE